MYKPGTHIIATLHSTEKNKLETCADFKEFINVMIEQYRLRRLGDVFHNFSPAGFTCVICLSESHISIHTWPEHGKINMDIYLSNHERNNDGTVTQLYEKTVAFFNATTEQLQTIYR